MQAPANQPHFMQPTSVHREPSSCSRCNLNSLLVTLSIIDGSYDTDEVKRFESSRILPVFTLAASSPTYFPAPPACLGPKIMPKKSPLFHSGIRSLWAT